jgi:hypothetical protein
VAPQFVRRDRVDLGGFAKRLRRAAEVRRVDRSSESVVKTRPRLRQADPTLRRSAFCRFSCALSATQTGCGKSPVLDCFVFVSPSLSLPRSFLSDPATVSVQSTTSTESFRVLVWGLASPKKLS